mgnify:CR=1 FL=1
MFCQIKGTWWLIVLTFKSLISCLALKPLKPACIFTAAFSTSGSVRSMSTSSSSPGLSPSLKWQNKIMSDWHLNLTNLPLNIRTSVFNISTTKEKKCQYSWFLPLNERTSVFMISTSQGKNVSIHDFYCSRKERQYSWFLLIKEIYNVSIHDFYRSMKEHQYSWFLPLKERTLVFMISIAQGKNISIHDFY